jgi:UDP-glucose 4-epimerase
MKNILVTGGSGYIGSRAVIELINAGYRPVIVDNFANSDKKVIERLKKLSGQDIVCYEQDFQDQEKLNSVMKNEKVAGQKVLYKNGGAMDYVKEGTSGKFFEEQTVESLCEAIKKFNPSRFSSNSINKSVNKFSTRSFTENFQEYIIDLK